MAERVGFEPTIPLRVCRISSAVLSTTQPPLRSHWSALVGAGCLIAATHPPRKSECDAFSTLRRKHRIPRPRARGRSRHWPGRIGAGFLCPDEQTSRTGIRDAGFGHGRRPRHAGHGGPRHRREECAPQAPIRPESAERHGQPSGSGVHGWDAFPSAGSAARKPSSSTRVP